MDVSFCGTYSSHLHREIEQTAAKISGRSIFSQIWLCGLVVGLSTIVFLASPLTPHLSTSMRWLLGALGLVYSVFALLWYSSWDEASERISLPEVSVRGRVIRHGVMLTAGGQTTVYLWDQIVACRVTNQLAVITLNTGAMIGIARDFFDSPFDWNRFLTAQRRCAKKYKRVPSVSRQEILFWVLFMVSTSTLWYSVMFS